MGGSGLEDCLQTVYGSSSVPKMLEGKAIKRACRKHGLECVAACGNCRGESCTNVIIENIEGDDIDDLDRNVFDLFI